MLPDSDSDRDAPSPVLTLAEEQATVGTRRVETARVRVAKRVLTRTETVDVPLAAEVADVRRVPVDRVVDAPPPLRQEGDVTIVSVVEERLVLTKQLVLKEELHIAVRRQTVRHPQQVTLRHEELSVEREELSEPGRSPPP